MLCQERCVKQRDSRNRLPTHRAHVKRPHLVTNTERSPSTALHGLSSLPQRQDMMPDWQAVFPPRTQLFPRLQTIVDPRVTLSFAESGMVPLRSNIVRYLRDQYLHPNGDLHNQGSVPPFFNGFNHPAERARIWVTIEFLSFEEGKINRLPETPQEWETHAGDMEWLEEIWLCLDDNRLISRHYTAEELEINRAPGLWQNDF